MVNGRENPPILKLDDIYTFQTMDSKPDDNNYYRLVSNHGVMKGYSEKNFFKKINKSDFIDGTCTINLLVLNSSEKYDNSKKVTIFNENHEAVNAKLLQTNSIGHDYTLVIPGKYNSMKKK